MRLFLVLVLIGVLMVAYFIDALSGAFLLTLCLVVFLLPSCAEITSEELVFGEWPFFLNRCPRGKIVGFEAQADRFLGLRSRGISVAWGEEKKDVISVLSWGLTLRPRGALRQAAVVEALEEWRLAGKLPVLSDL